MSRVGVRKPGSRKQRNAEVEALRRRMAFLEAQLKSCEGMSPQFAHDKPPSTAPDADSDRLAVTLDSIADAVITTTSTGLVERINPVAARLTGYDPREAIGLPLSEVFRVGSSHRSPGETLTLATTGAHGSATLDPITLWDRQGTAHSIELSASSIREHGERGSGTVLVFRDVTERREYEARRTQSDKLQAIGQLVGGLSHELNNLFSATMSFAELLRLRTHSGEDPEYGQYAESIVDNTRKASDLVGRLLAFSRERTRERAPVDLHHVIQDVLEQSADALRELNVELATDAPDAFVRGDAQALRDSLLNLLANAREAMAKGGRLRLATSVVELTPSKCKTSILPVSPGRYLKVEVADDGTGIPVALLGRIFEPFFTTKRGGPVSGLGLSVVYGTVRDHGGTIEIESAEERGTTVRLFLPLQGEIPITSLRPSHELVKGRGRLLLVDDEPTLRRAGAALLKRLGYDVSVAEDGIIALEIFSAAPKSYDLVLLDIIMPRMNGRETLRELRKIDPDVKALYISAFGLSSEDPSAEDGVQGVIRKPFTAATLSQRVSEVLGDAGGAPPGERNLAED